MRTAHASASLGAALRVAVRAVDQTRARGAITPVDQLVSDQTARHRVVMLALTFFGVGVVAGACERVDPVEALKAD